MRILNIRDALAKGSLVKLYKSVKTEMENKNGRYEKKQTSCIIDFSLEIITFVIHTLRKVINLIKIPTKIMKNHNCHRCLQANIIIK